MWLRWLPWRYVVRRMARAQGFIDPLVVWSRLRSFAEPAEVAAPVELLRAGMVFHARGLMNSAAIQHNLDWVWPFWVERQFDPLDDAFIPRAFSITHVNLTHRNWTAIGWPDCERMPIVDPHGLLTPFWDGWSLDAWVVTGVEQGLIPSRARSVVQRLDWTLPEEFAVVTRASDEDLVLESRARVAIEDALPVCVEQVTASAQVPAWLAIVLRPYNPEGVSFIHEVELQEDGQGWLVDGERAVHFSMPAEKHVASTYREGDVFATVPEAKTAQRAICDVGMCTAAALFKLEPGQTRDVTVRIPLADDVDEARREAAAGHYPGWPRSLEGHCIVRVPNSRMQLLYDAAVRTVVLHSPGDVYPGPYTYKRFWFRDAAFILHALLGLGLTARVKRTLDRFPKRQTRSGYFLSQEGEWDSNGEALWIMHRYCQLTGEPPDQAWERAILRGGEWIQRKLLSDKLPKAHAGLFPPGFSAEHLGPNDYYYWDDFWGVAGLRAAAALAEAGGDWETGLRFRQGADRLLAAINRSLSLTAHRRSRTGIPAAPYRRMDAGAIGSLAAAYPLQLWPSHDPRLLDTVEFLLEHCFVDGGFFQDMVHSGINPYLTLHVAQTLLRAGDARCYSLMETVARLASPTGQWPEAIHPRTHGGCMGDGQHVWAAAEWACILRNCFVHEELDAGALVLACGIPETWLASGQAMSCGPTPTPWGTISVDVHPNSEGAEVSWTAAWRGTRPRIEVRLPGFAAESVADGASSVLVKRETRPLISNGPHGHRARRPQTDAARH
jgi:hypothetical protein